MKDGRPIAFGEFEWRPAQRQLLVHGQPAALGARALDLLDALVERRDRVVGKNELLDLVWPGLVVEENNLQVQVSALRKVLGPQRIATIPGRGYRFTAAVGGDAAPVLPPAAPPGPGNLPSAPPLIGRDDELRALTALLGEHRLVTVVGAGGIGKTRLALAAAATLHSRWRDGVWLVEGAAVTDAARLPGALTQALRLAPGGERPTDQDLAMALQASSRLLLLDNCEHLLDAAAGLAETLLARAPGVHILVTSQERLNVQTEQVFRLQPLALPDRDEPAPDSRFGAIQLFVERARAADRSFSLDADNAGAVAEICRQLDGLPLAIELAAARVRLLGVHGLRDRLGDRFRLLTGGARSVLRRHQTLRAALEWSHLLLSADEQAVLRRLGVFVGGFTLELAQAVAADGDELDEWAVLDALGAMVDKSLVSTDAGEPVRYRLLESTRAFALERLAERGETAERLARHARAVCALFVETDERRFGDGASLSNAELMGRLGPEIDNARAALDWAGGEPGEAATAVGLAGASAAVFTQLGLSFEAQQRLQQLAPRVDAGIAPLNAARFWRNLSMLGNYGNLPAGEVLDSATRAVHCARAAGSRRRLHAALQGLGWALVAAADAGAAQALLPELIALERPADPPQTRSARLGLEAAILHERQAFDEALAKLAEQRGVLQAAPGERLSLMICESNLCLNLNCLGRFDEAATLARTLLARPDLPPAFNNVGYDLIYALAALGRADEAVEVARACRREWHRTPVLKHGCDSLAMLAAALGRLADAVRIDAAGQAHLRAAGLPPQPLTLQTREHLRQRCTLAGVADAECERWRVEGAALDGPAIVTLALQGSATGKRAGSP